jgi:hypothetical protein
VPVRLFLPLTCLFYLDPIVLHPIRDLVAGLGYDSAAATASNLILHFVIFKCQRPSAAVAHTPMPQTRSTPHRSGLPPVPVGIFLSTPLSRAASGPAFTGHTDWCGVPAHEVARLIAVYTAPGDLVIELDEHPTIAHAARYLGRQPAHLVTDGDHHRAQRPAPPAHRIYGRPRAGLVLARLPRAGADSLDLHGITRAMHAWRTLLRPGGYLLAALTAHGPEHGQVSHRATVIAAARTAGLSWQQEILVLRVPLSEYEPRVMTDTAGTTPAALIGGRHEPVHVKLLAFQHRAAGSDA